MVEGFENLFLVTLDTFDFSLEDGLRAFDGAGEDVRLRGGGRVRDGLDGREVMSALRAGG